MRHLILIATTLLSTCGATMAPPATGDSTDHPARLETPAYDSEEHIIEYNGFTVSYNHTTLVPNWVAYELTAEELEVKYDSRSSNFSRDPNLRGKQASREDYSHSGWDKGHMAPKADLRWSEQSYWQSHYFPNICPQNHQLNGGDWNTLEKTVRRWAKQPDAFFKALLVHDGKGYRAVAYIMPNEGKHHPLRHYACSVDQLEELIGRDLFPALDDETEASVEASVKGID